MWLFGFTWNQYEHLLLRLQGWVLLFSLPEPTRLSSDYGTLEKKKNSQNDYHNVDNIHRSRQTRTRSQPSGMPFCISCITNAIRESWAAYESAFRHGILRNQTTVGNRVHEQQLGRSGCVYWKRLKSVSCRELSFLKETTHHMLACRIQVTFVSYN